MAADGISSRDGLSVNGQYYVRISIVSIDQTTKAEVREYKDFIDTDCFGELVIDEQGRNYLPVMKIAFKLYEYGVLPYLNQGNKVRIVLGRNAETARTSDFIILGTDVRSEGRMAKQVILSCMFDCFPYLRENRVHIYPNMSSIGVLKEVFSRSGYPFSLDFGDSSPSDVQNWIQPGLTDRAFVNQVQVHCNYPDSFMAFGITSSGVVRVRDFTSHVGGGGYDWRFVLKPSDSEKDIVYEGDLQDVSEPGAMNLWKAGGSRILVYDMESGSLPLEQSSFMDPGLLSLSKSWNLRLGSASKVADVEYHGSNTFGDSEVAVSRNMQGLSAYSAQKVTLSFELGYRDVQVLDVVYVVDPDSLYKKNEETNRGSRQLSLQSANLSGRYLVSKVTRGINDRIFYTAVELCRESPGEIIGAFEEHVVSDS